MQSTVLEINNLFANKGKVKSCKVVRAKTAEVFNNPYLTTRIRI